MAHLQQSESRQQSSMPCSDSDSPTPAWSPDKDGAEVAGLLPTPKLRKVEQCIGTPDILSRLKGTPIGHFYAKHLKQIPIVRWIVIWAWRNLYPVYTNYIVVSFGFNVAKRWRPLVKLEEYVKTTNIQTVKVLDAAKVETPVPKVFPVEDLAYLVSPHDHYEFPPAYVAEISDAKVYGGTNLVFARDAVICHDLYDFERDYTSEELYGRHLIDAIKRRMRLLCHDSAPERIPAAATFVDACAPNYAHWLTEVLPRVAAFCSEERFANIPIIVNDGLHHNIIESLALVAGTDRVIISLPIGRAIRVDSLYVTSVTGYVPFERRDNKLTGHSHGLFSPLAFDLMRRRVFSFVDNFPSQDWPKKIYLRRTSGARKVTNATELENVLSNNGYVAVEPEKLTFLQQVALFRNVDDIVGSSGAALANFIFASPKANIHILIGKYDGTSYWYWQNMAVASGKLVQYFLGDTTIGNIKGIHDDFSICEDEVFKVLSQGGVN
ncbi:glycosyltransferase family 61 protein [Sedimenticola hydrogenitrophicus]|uniref:glycosyltransferase family 61 protein n=1 Tax=Sedimenticola hydrogenitrophicus TaxID=2967975 RepID=UPI0023AEB8E7|nr:glycosyltransferase 61 family protein [Sedimenticola hydrogenitrophicus]